MSEVWVASTDEECWNGSEEYATREAAVHGAPAEFELEPGERFYVGRRVSPNVRKIATGLGGMVVDRLHEDACDEFGEPADDSRWPEASREDEADLDAALAEAVVAWIERRGLVPTFWTVEAVSEHLCEEGSPLPPSEAPEGEPQGEESGT